MTNPSSFVPGIHYFCDHRCWRCGLTGRCAVFARWVALPKRGDASNPSSRVASSLAVSLEVTMEEATVLTASRVGPPGRTPVPSPSQSPIGAPAPAPIGALAPARIGAFAPGTFARPPRPRDPLLVRVEHDSLVVRGTEYAHASWPVLRALRPILAARADPDATAMEMDAAERLEETCITVASKVFRTVSSSLDADFDPADTQSDANGSAKVALLLIEESRQAWRVLMQPGRAAANGVPARLVLMLDAIEAELLRRFPRALEFVRPGFDTGLANGANGQVATAMLGAGRPAGTA